MINKSVKSIFLGIAKYILIGIVLYFVYLQLSKNWSDVVNYQWTLNIPILILSIMMHLLTFVLFSYFWCVLIKAFGHDVRLKHGFKIGYITNLGRYIPGKIWPVIGMAYIAKKLNIKEETSVTSWIVALIFTLPSAFLAGLLCIMLSSEIRNNEIISGMGIGFYITILLLFLITLALIFIPNQSFIIVNKILKLFKRPQISFNIDLKTAFMVYFGYFICWICYGFAFWLFVMSISSNYSLPAIPTIGAFILAYQIGYLAFFAPGGVGVRELVLTTILVPYLGPISAGVAIAARIWNMIVEIIAAVIAWNIKIRNN